MGSQAAAAEHLQRCIKRGDNAGKAVCGTTLQQAISPHALERAKARQCRRSLVGALIWLPSRTPLLPGSQAVGPFS